MARNINKSETDIVGDFLNMKGTFVRTVTRANGELDRKAIPNIVTAEGLNVLASRAVADAIARPQRRHTGSPRPRLSPAGIQG